MKTSGLTTLLASVVLGLSLGAWANTTVCGVATNNPQVSLCHYVDGHLSTNQPCTANYKGPGSCDMSGSPTHQCVRDTMNFPVYTSYSGNGCPSTGTDAGAQSLQLKCTGVGTPTYEYIYRATDLNHGCTAVPEGPPLTSG